MINNLDMELRCGQMDPGSKAPLKMDRKRAWVNSSGTMGQPTSATFLATKFMGLVSTSGLIKENTMAIGTRIGCMEMELSLGLMAGNTLASMFKIKSKDTESFVGNTVVVTKVSGMMGNSMGKDALQTQADLKSSENGAKEGE